MNDTTQPGYLTAFGDLPMYDEALDQALIPWIQGLSGLPAGAVVAEYVNPQPTPPLPETNGCGFSLTEIQYQASPVSVTKNADADYQRQVESLVIRCRFYGAQGQCYASAFRSGLYIAQNNAELNRIGLTLGDAGSLIATPELINNQWQRRYDLYVTLRRQTEREYGIKSFLSTPVQISGD